MAEGHCPQAHNIMILTCPECANGGQLANRTAEELSEEGYGRRLCLADVGVPVSRITSFIQSVAKDVLFIIAIDGCSRGCAKKELEKARLPMNNYLVVMDRGIGKDKDLNLTMEIIGKFKVSIKDALSGNIAQ
jgi:uncharacterized metal-binding protein